MTPEMQAETSENRRPPLWAIILAFIVLLAFLGLLAMGLLKSYEGSIGIGKAVNPFELTTFDGGTFNTGDYAGKVIVVNFWASWCQPCESEAAELEEAWRYFEPSGKVIFLGVDYADTETEARQYLTEYEISYPNGPDLQSDISRIFRVRGVPETFIIDGDGNLAYFKIGPFFDTAEVISAVEGVLEGGHEE